MTNPKLEIRNSKPETHTTKQYDLEGRTLQFAKDVRAFVKKLPKNTGNFEDGKQLIRSSGSVGANYIEANESLSKKDFAMRVKISRKEAKESGYWLQLVDTNHNQQLDHERQALFQEALELMLICAAIIKKAT